VSSIILVAATADYPGSANDLEAPILDATRMIEVHAGAGWEVVDLLDSAATRSRFLQRVRDLWVPRGEGLQRRRIYWSGHGSWTTDLSGDEPDRRDETICLYDGDLLDDEVAAVLDEAPSDFVVDVVSDCCHGGTNTRRRAAPGTPRYRPPPAAVARAVAADAPVRGRFWLGRFLSWLSRPPETGQPTLTPILDARAEGRIAFQASAPREYSYEIPDGGVFTTALVRELEKNRGATWRELAYGLGLPNEDYPQTPQLEGDPRRFDEPFLLA
jgi:hypothetical protein